MDSNALETSLGYIRNRVETSPAIGVILGSGLGDFADNLSEQTTISTSDIPHYPVSTVTGHKGKLIFGLLGSKTIVAFQGRTHFYESKNLETVLYPIYIAHALGIKTLIITNAAGGINRSFLAGDLMIINDQINLLFERLPSLPSETICKSIYTPSLIEVAEKAAAENAITVRKGVYVGLKGPSYETASEIEMLYRLGGDAAGMSTVCEASLASSLGIEVLGISCITNLATGISPTKLSHAEVTEVGNKVKTVFANLLSSTIKLM